MSLDNKINRGRKRVLQNDKRRIAHDGNEKYN